MRARIIISMFRVSSSLRLAVVFCLVVLISSSSVAALGQQSLLPDAPTPQNQSSQTDPQAVEKKGRTDNGQEDKASSNHIFWLIPNHRADESGAEIKPLTSHAKFKLAVSDAFDPSTFLIAGFFAGTAMARRQYPAFGNGAGGFGKYYGAAVADQLISDTLTEGLFPIILHQDPRYFVKQHGGFWQRTKYAIGREVITRTDDGRNQFNMSEIGGVAVAAGISAAYYPSAQRTFGDVAGRWGQQIALDAFLNVTKEFWPDIRTKFFGK